MRKPIKILLQTTIPAIEDDWNIDRFSLLGAHLAALKNEDGDRLCEVVARNREKNEAGDDEVLSKLDSLDIDELWLFAVDPGDGLSANDCEGITRFRHARVVATGRSLVTGRSFNLVVAFERNQDDHGNYLGRAVADSSFHHFVDYNWDTDHGCPSFLEEPPGGGIKRELYKLENVTAYVRNLALWLGPSEAEATPERASNSLSSINGPIQLDSRHEPPPQRT